MIVEHIYVPSKNLNYKIHENTYEYKWYHICFVFLFWSFLKRIYALLKKWNTNTPHFKHSGFTEYCATMAANWVPPTQANLHVHCTLENNYLRYLGQKTWYVFFMEKNIKDIGFSFFFFWNSNAKYLWFLEFICRNYEVELLIEWYYFDMIL